MENLSSFSFKLKTKIVFDHDSEKKLPDILRELGFEKPVIVTDKGVREAGLLDGFLKSLEKSNISAEIFDDIEPNPKDYNVDDGVDKIKESECDGIVAIGGGSPIDCAKAMAAVASLGGSARDYSKRGLIEEDVMPLIAVPTTAGTGSEVTIGAVITDTERKFKYTIKGNSLAPKVALIDPELTVSMPPSITAATGMDALTHAIEGYTVKQANPLTDAPALHAIELISRHLRTSYRRGDNMEARTGMLLGSLLAGIAFSHSDVGSVHCIAEALGGMYDIPHGVCNAVMLPTVMNYNLPYCEERYARVATAMGLEWNNPKEGALKAVEEVREMAEDVELPDFSSFGVEPGDFSEIAEKSYENGSNSSNPRPMKPEDYEKILRVLQKS